MIDAYNPEKSLTKEDEKKHVALFDFNGVLVKMTADDGKTSWGNYMKREYPSTFDGYESGNPSMVYKFERLLEEVFSKGEIIAHPVPGALDLLRFSKEQGNTNINYTTCTEEFVKMVLNDISNGEYMKYLDGVYSQLDMFPDDPKSKSLEGFKRILGSDIAELFIDDKAEPLFNARKAMPNARLYNVSSKEMELPYGTIQTPTMEDVLRYEKEHYKNIAKDL